MVSLCVDCLAAMTVSSCENSRTYAYLDCLCLLIINDLMYTTLFREQTTCKSDRIDALVSISGPSMKYPYIYSYDANHTKIPTDHDMQEEELCSRSLRVGSDRNY